MCPLWSKGKHLLEKLGIAQAYDALDGALYSQAGWRLSGMVMSKTCYVFSRGYGGPLQLLECLQGDLEVSRIA